MLKLVTSPKNHSSDFDSNMSLIDWMSQWKNDEDDMQVIRGTLGRLLFSQNDINKPVNVISGGEQRRMLFGKLILQRPNVIIMDEPTNHLDMESIESLNGALDSYPGTLIFCEPRSRVCLHIGHAHYRDYAG